MKTTSLAYWGFALLLGLGNSPAADQPAIVQEVFNDVHYGSSESANHTQQAGVDTLIHDGQFVGTGGEGSRAELKLPSLSITRMGPNTIFNYTVANNTVDLQEGTILFCKPKGDGVRTLNIKTAAVMAGIVGTTGFVDVYKNPKTHQTTYSLGLVEGHAVAHADGLDIDLGPGEEVQFTPPNKPIKLSFDVPKFVKTSILFTGFKGHLPNQKYIDDEIADYNDKVSRGFIQPSTGNQTNTNYAGIPIFPNTTLDSAQNAQGDQPHGGPPPSNFNRTGP